MSTCARFEMALHGWCRQCMGKMGCSSLWLLVVSLEGVDFGGACIVKAHVVAFAVWERSIVGASKHGMFAFHVDMRPSSPD